MSQPARILLALVLGFAIGMAGDYLPGGPGMRLVPAAETIGGLWLDGLRMTIVPLVVALLVTGIGATADAARAGGVAGRSIATFLVLLATSATLSALLMPLLLHIFPLPSDSAATLRDALGASEPIARDVPGLADFLRGIVPSNPVAAAAGDSILPLILFTTVFGFAITRIEPDRRRRLTDVFAATADAMLVVIRWVLWLAPAGVFALAYVVGARAGTQALGALLHYIAIVSAVGIAVGLLAYPIAVFGGRVPLVRFARTVAPAQAVAISTQSSLASLPVMLEAAARLGVRGQNSGITLPLAVALFRVTGPAMNLAVALYVAHWFGLALTPLQIAAGVAVAVMTSLGSVSLPGQVSFVTSIAPIAVTLGVPIAPLALLIAVETIPDIFRTLGNVTMDVAVTRAVARDDPLEPVSPEPAAPAPGAS